MARIKSKVNINKNTKTKRNINVEIVGIVVISLGIMSLVSMYSESTGFVGDLIRKFSMFIAGFGGYIFPIIILLLGFFFVINKIDYIKKSASIIILYFSFLTLIDINLFSFVDGLTFAERIKYSIEACESAIMSGNSAVGGGVIGSALSYIFLSLFGTVGSYIIIFTILLISFLLFTNISLMWLLKGMISKLSIVLKLGATGVKDFVYIESNEINDTKKNNKVKDRKSKSIVEKKEEINTDVTTSSEIDNKIRILDYTKSTGDGTIHSVTDAIEKNEVEEECINIKIGETIEKDIYENYKFPNIDLLKDVKSNNKSSEKKEVLLNANKLIDTLRNFGIEAKIMQISIGPSITRYELQPAPGVKVSRIVSLTNDIALSLASSDIRMEAPIPGKSAIGIEVPNKSKTGVGLKEILQSNEYSNIDTLMPIALGKDITGSSIVANIEKMPHLLIAGATGSGKSVCINTIITSIIFKARPDEVKLLLIDPKVVELSVYNGIPHLLIPVVTDPKKAAFSLNWAVQEMTKRYNLFAKNSVRDLTSYNNKAENNAEMERIPQLVIIIDELADLMMVSASEVEDYICRLAQMARAAGIHLIVATQRPSVDIITGTIKANIPSRISFAVSSQTDSRTILDMGGAEKLLGKGDMLFYPVGESKPIRIQGAFISEEEVTLIVESLKSQFNVQYEDSIIGEIDNNIKVSGDDSDDLLPRAIEIVVDEGQASISLLQRRLKIGYARAARIVDEMEERGIVGGYEGSKPRKVLITKDELGNN